MSEDRRTDQPNPRRRHPKGLGRGLGALLSRATVSGAQAEGLPEQDEAGGIRQLPTDAILANPQQPRTRFDPDSLAELAASIRQHGVIQPLIVTRATDQPQRFWLITGERRWRAARQAGIPTVPGIVREATRQQLLEWALVENLQRADLNPLEEAAAYSSLMNEFKLTQATIAERVGKSRSAIANTVRLLGLPSAALVALSDQLISAGHARALLSLESAEDMQRALDLIIERELNVRQTETPRSSSL